MLLARRSANAIMPQPPWRWSPIDQNEAAHVAIVGVRIECNGPVQRDIAKSDLVEIQMLGGDVLGRMEVDFIFEPGDAAGNTAGAKHQQI